MQNTKYSKEILTNLAPLYRRFLILSTSTYSRKFLFEIKILHPKTDIAQRNYWLSWNINGSKCANQKKLRV